MPEQLNLEERAKRFAQLLDQDDFNGAIEYIEADCRYSIRGKDILGTEAILASYRSSSDFTKRNFDKSHYSSQIKRQSDTEYLVTFTDRISKNGVEQVYHCQQLLRFNLEGKIEGITHKEIPGEAERLQAYFEKVGVRR